MENGWDSKVKWRLSPTATVHQRIPTCTTITNHAKNNNNKKRLKILLDSLRESANIKVLDTSSLITVGETEGVGRGWGSSSPGARSAQRASLWGCSPSRSTELERGTHGTVDLWSQADRPHPTGMRGSERAREGSTSSWKQWKRQPQPPPPSPPPPQQRQQTITRCERFQHSSLHLSLQNAKISTQPSNLNRWNNLTKQLPTQNTN